MSVRLGSMRALAMTYPGIMGSSLVFEFAQIFRLFWQRIIRKTTENREIRFRSSSLKRDVVKSEEVQRMGSRKWCDIMQQLLHKENKCLQDLFSLSEKDSAIPPSDDRGLEYHKWPGGNE